MKKIGNLILEKYTNKFNISIWCRYKNYLLVFGYMNYVERNALSEFSDVPHRYNKLAWYYCFNKNFFNSHPRFPFYKKSQKELQRLDLKLFGKIGIRYI